MRGILYTRHDGGVSVTYPTSQIFDVMSSGGYWNDRPRGFLQAQIERQIADGIDPDHAKRFAYAVQFGGRTEAEVWEIIRDRDCARHGTMHELVDALDLPDRMYRDAWARGHNGGPVFIDLAKARLIHWRKITTWVEAENKRRRESLDIEDEFKFDETGIRWAIKRARDEDELRRIWPCTLS